MKYKVLFFLKLIKKWDEKNNLTLEQAQEESERLKRKGYKTQIAKEQVKEKQNKLF